MARTSSHADRTDYTLRRGQKCLVSDEGEDVLLASIRIPSAPLRLRPGENCCDSSHKRKETASNA